MAILQTGKVGIPPIQINPLGYSGDEQNVVPITSADREPTGLDRNYSTGTEWFVNTTQDTWKLYGFIDGLANWKILSSGSVPGGTVISLSGDANTQVFPDGIGNIQIEGTAGQITVTEDAGNNKLVLALAGGGTGIDQIAVDANTPPGTNPVVATGSGQVTISGDIVTNQNIPIQSTSLSANSLDIQVQYATTNATANAAKAGLSSFDSTSFTVNPANGWVQMSGGAGPAAQKFNVQANTAPGTDPVVPSGTGEIILDGSIVTNHNIPIQTNSIAVNEIDVEVQYTTTNATANAAKAGMASFNSNQFTVDAATGWVSLPGSGTGSAATVYDTDSVGNVSPASGIVKVYGQTGSLGATTGIQVGTDAADTILVRMLSPYTQGDFAFQSTSGGTTRTLTTENTVDAASSQSTNLIKVAGGTSGDVWTQYTVGTTTSFGMGIDNSDSDNLKITYNNSGTINPSSGTTYFTMGVDGAVVFQSSNSNALFSQPVGGGVNSGYRAFCAQNTSSGTSASCQITLKNDVISREAGMIFASTTNTNPTLVTPPDTLFIFTNTTVTGGIQIAAGAVGTGISLRINVVGSANAADTVFRVIPNGASVGSVRCSSFMDTTAGGGQGARILNGANYEIARDTSSAKYKTNIRPLDKGLDTVSQMKPCYYTSLCKNDDPDMDLVGFIAEEMYEIVPEATVMANGVPDGISYDRLTAVLCKAIQELKQELDDLRLKVESQSSGSSSK